MEIGTQMWYKGALAAAMCAAILWIPAAGAATVPCNGTHLGNAAFCVQFDDASAGVMRLDSPADSYGTNYVIGSSEHPQFTVADSRWFGDVVFRFRSGAGPWQHASTAHSRDARTLQQSNDAGVQAIVFHYRSDPANADGIRGFDFDEKYELRGGVLLWSLTLRNETGQPLEIGDIGLPLLFNTIYSASAASDLPGDPRINFEKRVVRHNYIAGDNSFVFWTRGNGVGPYLLMTPRIGTHLEFFEPTGRGSHADSTDPVFYPESGWGGLYTAYIHAAAEGGDFETQGTWRQPLTSVVLAPRDRSGSSVTYAFQFQWEPDYRAIRDILYRNGLIDVKVAPGMVIPSNLSALVALHTREPIHAVTAEYPSQTEVTPLPSGQKDTRVYRISFHRLGENEIAVSFGNGRSNLAGV